ncbi:hypothetical protein HK096_003596, partial [Nowakowskiella sp. JEL0078]
VKVTQSYKQSNKSVSMNNTSTTLPKPIKRTGRYTRAGIAESESKRLKSNEKSKLENDSITELTPKSFNSPTPTESSSQNFNTTTTYSIDSDEFSVNHVVDDEILQISKFQYTQTSDTPGNIGGPLVGKDGRPFKIYEIAKAQGWDRGLVPSKVVNLTFSKNSDRSNSLIFPSLTPLPTTQTFLPDIVPNSLIASVGLKGVKGLNSKFISNTEINLQQPLNSIDPPPPGAPTQVAIFNSIVPTFSDDPIIKFQQGYPQLPEPIKDYYYQNNDANWQSTNHMIPNPNPFPPPYHYQFQYTQQQQPLPQIYTPNWNLSINGVHNSENVFQDSLNCSVNNLHSPSEPQFNKWQSLEENKKSQKKQYGLDLPKKRFGREPRQESQGMQMSAGWNSRTLSRPKGKILETST